MSKLFLRLALALQLLCIFSPNEAFASSGNYWCAGNQWGAHESSAESAAAACAGIEQFENTEYYGAARINSVSCGAASAPGSDHIANQPCTVKWQLFQKSTQQWFDEGSSPIIGLCVSPYTYSTLVNACSGFGDRYFDGPAEDICLPCLTNIKGMDPVPGFGNPIYPDTGSKRQSIDLGFAVGGQDVTVTYDTKSKLPEASGGQTWLVPPPPSFGPLWQSNFHKSVAVQSPTSIGAAFSSVAMTRGSSSVETASVVGSDTCSGSGGGSTGGNYSYQGTVNPNEHLQLTGSGSAGLLVDSVGLVEEVYGSSGSITSAARAGGSVLTFSYTSGLLTTVSDQFGRQVAFAYEQPSVVTFAQRIKSITGPDGSVINVGYDTNDNLATLTWADTNVETLVYENASFPWALTGVVDESTQRYGTYGYDAQGRANSTYTGSGVNRYSVTYGTAPQWAVTETEVAGSFLCREHRFAPAQNTVLSTPSGASQGLTSALTANRLKSTGQSQPQGSGSAAASTSLGYDSNGNLTQFDGLDGNRACFAYDSARAVPLVILEGLPGGTSGKACPANLTSYVPSPSDAAHPERKTTTVWHPDWVLKSQEAGPKKITTWVYNGQPDPIAGTTASCVSPATTLPDGKPLAVLCARYEQATTDATGALGLGATVSGPVRAWTYTYNQYGQVLTETTPKQAPTDPLSHTTTYVYYPATSFSGSVGHTMGDLNTVTNPLGQVTTFLTYDKAGRLLSSKDANLTVTSMTYWPRGWLHTQTVTPATGTALTTTYDYWPTGLLKTVTMPDASTLNYTYDDAHRLTDVTDAVGNKVHYVLDNVGNRTSEQVSDASGQLASSISRVYDALNRVQSSTGAMH